MRRGASHDNRDDRSGNYAVLDALRRKEEAERQEWYAVAEHQHDSCDYRSLRSSVGMQFSTLCVAGRTQGVRKGMTAAR